MAATDPGLGGEEIPDPLQELLLEDIEVTGRELGVGSYSSVVELCYKGMKCAGKKLHSTLYDQGVAIGPEILERFGIECELLSQLRHPHVVQFLGLHFEENSDVPILVLEFMPCALSDCVERYNTFPDEISHSLLHDVSLGLNYLHSHSPVIIHRDLTANNVLLTSSMTAKISDLGMAKILNIAPAQMSRRMTICPGTVSYMPPETLTSNPRYDTKLDCFSFGVLMIHIFCGEWPIALEYLQPDPQRPGHLYPLTEIERREKFLQRIGNDHPLMGLIQRCLKNIPSERPNAAEILSEVSQVALRYPATFENRIEVLNQIKANANEEEKLRKENTELQRLLHEKEHKIENLCFTYGVEMERMREQIMKYEQGSSLRDTLLAELQAENSRLQLNLNTKTEEVELMKKRVEFLSAELEMANTKLEEKAKTSMQKLKQLQTELVAKTQEREAALQRLTRGHLDAALKHTFSGRPSEDLASEFEEFFLSNADDLTELLKRSQRSPAGNTTHFQAQQMVCSMVQHCYTHCKDKLLEQLCRQMERLFSVDNSQEAQDTLRDISIAFGLLVRAAQPQASQYYSEALCEKAFPKFLEKFSFRVSSRATEASLRHHMRQACKLTWDLVTAWPPPIIARPNEFREDWHDREFQYWEKKSPQRSSQREKEKGASAGVGGSSKHKLFYTRPILFHSYEGRVGAKGWVGNKDKDSSTSPKKTPPTERANRKTNKNFT